MVQPSAPRFMTVTEVADMIHSGEMPAIRVGKSFRVPEAAVSQMIHSGLADRGDEQNRAIGG